MGETDPQQGLIIFCDTQMDRSHVRTTCHLPLRHRSGCNKTVTVMLRSVREMRTSHQRETLSCWPAQLRLVVPLSIGTTGRSEKGPKVTSQPYFGRIMHQRRRGLLWHSQTTSITTLWRQTSTPSCSRCQTSVSQRMIFSFEGLKRPGSWIMLASASKSFGSLGTRDYKS